MYKVAFPKGTPLSSTLQNGNPLVSQEFNESKIVKIVGPFAFPIKTTNQTGDSQPTCSRLPTGEPINEPIRAGAQRQLVHVVIEVQPQPALGEAPPSTSSQPLLLWHSDSDTLGFWTWGKAVHPSLAQQLVGTLDMEKSSC